MAGQHRRDTAANIASVDPYLRTGELLLATDTGDTYIGDNLNPVSGLLPFEPRSGVILIGHQTLGSAAAQIDITIPDRDDLVKLEIWIRTRGSGASSIYNLFTRFNGITTSIYDYQTLSASAATVSAAASRATSSVLVGGVPAAGAQANSWGSTIIEIPFPRNVGPWRTISSRNGSTEADSTTYVKTATVNGWLRRGMKIDTVSLYLSGSVNFLADTQVMALGWVDK